MEIRDVKDRDDVFHGPLFGPSIMEVPPERVDLLSVGWLNACGL
jgi:hypothetical protein